MFVFTVLIRAFESGTEIRARDDKRFSSLKAAEAARQVWIESGQRVSPVVRMTGGSHK